jgi:hypothetical protein
VKHESRIPRAQWDETPDNDWKSGERGVRVLDAETGVEVGDSVDILTVLADGQGQSRRWNALWVEPEAERAVYFEVIVPGGTRLCSTTFRTSDPQGPGHAWEATANACTLHSK